MPEEGQQAKAEIAVALLSKLSAENWVLFADNAGIAAAMKETLELAGAKCTTVLPGRRFNEVSATEFEVNPADGKDLDLLFESVAFDNGTPTAVVHLWSSIPIAPVHCRIPDGAQATGSQSFRSSCRRSLPGDWQQLPRLWMVTLELCPQETPKIRCELRTHRMWGIGLSIAREHPEVHRLTGRSRAAPGWPEARELAFLICCSGKEDRIALRGNSTYVARIAPFVAKAAGSAAQTSGKWRAVSDRDSIAWHSGSSGVARLLASRPGAGEVTLKFKWRA